MADVTLVDLPADATPTSDDIMHTQDTGTGADQKVTLANAATALATIGSYATADSTTTFTNKTIDADGTGNSITNIEDANIKAAAAIDATKIGNGDVTSTELSYINSVTSNVQTQLNAKGVLDNVVEDTTPQLGGNLDLNNKGFTRIETAGESLVAGDLTYLKSDGKYWKADASAEATANTDLLLCNAVIAADATGEFIEYGEYTTTGLTAGSVYYMSETAGAITLTKPTTSTSIVRIIGYAESTTVLKFKPDASYVENA